MSLHTFWENLLTVDQFLLNVRQGSNHWFGQGEVVVEKVSNHVLIFHERGMWHNQRIKFTNRYRWTLDHKACRISLEHLRRGIEHPVFLLHMIPSTGDSLASLDEHLCGTDRYVGQLFFSQSLHLQWRVSGPRKSQEINCYYA